MKNMGGSFHSYVNVSQRVVGPRLIDGRGFWGVLGGLITFLAARLTRYSLGLAATLKREMAITK